MLVAETGRTATIEDHGRLRERKSSAVVEESLVWRRQPVPAPAVCQPISAVEQHGGIAVSAAVVRGNLVCDESGAN